ncbi:hypothetical protein JKP88DRAFT_348492 [Tribonema minus]|uniref:Uncharacterized protein n=1 Tax=Tribonema minus TaxID=303371 RepID=A0A836CFB2_9STRA|nr:hypothetical protein JKP88DRAFT_348492 [Tribonema minus]
MADDETIALVPDFGKVIFDQPTDGVAPETLFPEQECTGSVAHVRDGDTDYFMMDFRVRDGTGLGFGAVANRDGSGTSFVLEYTAGGTVCITDALPEVELYGNAFEMQSCSDGWFFAAPDDAMSKPAPGGLTYTVREGASPWKNNLNFSGVVYSVPPPDAPRHRRRRARRTQDLVLLHQRFHAAGDAHATNDAAFLDLTFTGNLLDVDAGHFEALLSTCRGGGGGAVHGGSARRVSGAAARDRV